MANRGAPSLSVTLALSPTKYSFSDPVPPTLSLAIESHAKEPITVLTWAKPFHPQSALEKEGFEIFDLTTSSSVTQVVARIQRTPFSRVRGSSDEEYFLTLHPHTPITISTFFNSGGSADIRPYPKSIVERGLELDEHGNETGTRRPEFACGVDGLEPGHRYRLSVNRERVVNSWWRWGTKEDGILVAKGSLDWSLSSVESEVGPLEVGEINSVEFSIEE
jgi:hypothetical protein